ncbi:MAG: DNA-binding helix-turn-helix protein [Candidatus Curtissbacteria bacterium GW2011_GWA1_40_9]|uniref:DNA-binding helix-turn-helix protein n=1 Tax=Candidatus Curtissbacteria bacterium GW2011_GWA1_40_9 TaxID=1618408 RepID=A0A0G0WRT8_9BACT|nr:MAG: DNA-binding helix-turn-helix protein [Candidatus Curtissbacteria bacterium GW2011_GWA1_40_9]
MQKFGDLVLSTRKKKKISLDKVAHDLRVKREHLEALEAENWNDLPEPAFIKGYIKNYAEYLNLDPNYVLALYRRDYDETKYPQHSRLKKEKRFFITPNKITNTIFAIAVMAFLIYIAVQYSSIFSSPKLEITNPKSSETTSTPAIQIEGKTEKDATVSINGQFIAVDSSGNFSHQFLLNKGKNTIEIVASFRLSPKNKLTREIRLIE